MESKVTDKEGTSILSKSSKKYFTTDVIKKTTNFSNQQILDLCKNGIVQPRKTLDGKIYFTKDDFSIMQKLSKAHEELGLIEKSNNDKDTNDVKATKNIGENDLNNEKTQFKLTPKIKLPKLSQPVQPVKNECIEFSTQNELKETLNIKELENNLINKMDNLLSKKLDGLDEVVVELIRTKTEINMLRSKLDEMEAKNYNLSKEVNSYKNIGLGLYIKTKEDIKS